MAPTPSSKTQSFSTPSSKSNQSHFSKTPNSKHKLNFNLSKPSPNPNSAAKENNNNNNPAAEHPVEVIGRIREIPEHKKNLISSSSSALHINQDSQSLRVKTEFGYRDFSFDGVSLSENEDLEAFYKKFIESRINDVKLGAKCTIMMYGPTGSGKSHTMFGCSKQKGIVYRSLKDILGEGEDVSDENGEKGISVLVTVLEIYNEEIYDLLSTNNSGGFSLGWPKGGSASKVKLEVMGKKAKNATFISGHEATKISKEIEKVEKRRIVKSTLCNERSSRSHCMIILDVPKVGGQLMLVDMAGSENIEQAGQIGFEAKMQTAKINQGNTALKRVVESIANGDSHVPFRDSKLTMLLQDSFEDSKSKILMILCASPDPKELHKTISTLEYGAKAKCIVRGPNTPIKDKASEDSSAVILGSRISAMDQFICKLQMEKKLREKECNQANEELQKKEKELSELRAKLALVEGKGVGESEEKINSKESEWTQELKSKLEKKIQECQKIADEFAEKERKMEERTFQQQQELEMLRQRLEEIESHLSHSSRVGGGSVDMEGSGFMRKLLENCSDDSGMVKSMDLDRSFDLDAGKREVMIYKTGINNGQTISGSENIKSSESEEDYDVVLPNLSNKSFLSTVFEEDEEEDNSGDDQEKFSDEEVQKEVIEEKKVCFSTPVDTSNSSRRMRLQNIFTLCGNYRELSQKSENNIDPLAAALSTPDNEQKKLTEKSTTFLNSSVEKHVDIDTKENDYPPPHEKAGGLNVHVKWEASNDNPGKFITTLKVIKDSTLADLRKLIEIHLGADNQAFTFLVLGDPSGAPVPREKEATTLTTKLPICNNRLGGHLACLRPVKGIKQIPHIPFTSLENKLPVTPIPTAPTKHVGGYLSPELPEHLSSTPFITLRRH